jgi:DnaJ-domain-containing protein 1
MRVAFQHDRGNVEAAQPRRERHAALSAADDDAVSKAYRRQLSRHHPDKLKANGLPESMLEHAKQRTQQIIEAWEVIRATRGIRS